jgi:hypothetical protein
MEVVGELFSDSIALHKTSMIPFAQITAQTQTVAQTGIGLGSAIAVVCSWQRNRSILWAILAGILSWFYVVYFALTRRPDEMK